MTRFAVLASCVVVASFPLTASAQAADQDQHQRELVSSTVATAEAVLDAWLAGTVPAHYAKRTVSTMGKNLTDLIAKQQAFSSHPADSSSGTQQAFQRIGAALDRAQQAIRAADRPAAARSLEEVRSAVAPADKGAASQP
ncbi:hypothetical protein [Microvirga calopogonii]|uniref:hypothetical protein n=1 Tax=Microvirga calopogonii TaxID=2078013 RepID=UPI0013B39516|nr:hypothetical protein [Microvirga calopogonii]